MQVHVCHNGFHWQLLTLYEAAGMTQHMAWVSGC
jgi:hypothetical protein